MEQGKETGAGGALKEGALLDGWKVVKLLAKGGMAEVYEVEDVQLGVRYALKLFTYERGEQEAVRRRFFAEEERFRQLQAEADLVGEELR